MLTFIDDFSRNFVCSFLKHKDNAFETFMQWKIMIEKQTGTHIKQLQTDNGLEFVLVNLMFFVLKKSLCATSNSY